MNITTIKSAFWLAVAFTVTLLMQVALIQPAHAASIAWDGEGDGTTFADATNWVGDVAPVADDDIVLDTTGLTSVTFDNDLVDGTQFGSITLNGVGSGTFTLTGNSVILTGGLENSATYNSARFNVEIDITLNGDQAFTANSKLVVGASGGSNTLDVSTFTMTKAGAAPLLINSAASGSGGITVSNGNFEAVGTGSVAITIATGGTLSGSGTVGDVTVNSGGTVAPGTSPGCLSTGDITYTSGSTYNVEIDGANDTCDATDGYDQTLVTGTVDLGDATLVIDKASTYTPADGATYTIIDNDGTDAVTGTFNGLAEGGTTTVDGVEYTVSYVGGDGNDVVLSATVVAAPATGFGSISANYALIALFTALAAATLVVTGRKLDKVKK